MCNSERKGRLDRLNNRLILSFTRTDIRARQHTKAGIYEERHQRRLGVRSVPDISMI